MYIVELVSRPLVAPVDDDPTDVVLLLARGDTESRDSMSCEMSTMAVLGPASEG